MVCVLVMHLNSLNTLLSNQPIRFFRCLIDQLDVGKIIIVIRIFFSEGGSEDLTHIGDGIVLISSVRCTLYIYI